MQTFVQFLDLVDSKEAIEAYCRIHDEIWPEITKGVRSVGIDKMDIYLNGNRAVMILEMPDDVDLDEAMDCLAVLPRQQEWEEFVGKYQLCPPESSSVGKWKRMKKIFQLPEL